MSRTLEIQELAIAIATQNQNPAILTPDFLKYSGIVPQDWELAQAPINSPNVSQVMFQNGVGITVQRDRIVFAEAISTKESSEIVIPEIARKYFAALPNLEYRAIGINPRGHAVMNDLAASQQYMSQTLLSPGAWQHLSESPIKASLQLSYKLEQSIFNLSVTDAALQLPDQKLIPVILFSGNFNYTIPASSQQERLEFLAEKILNWQADLDTFRDAIQTKFLATGTVLEAAPTQPVLPLV
jgi:hypothetical protein